MKLTSDEADKEKGGDMLTGRRYAKWERELSSNLAASLTGLIIS